MSILTNNGGEYSLRIIKSASKNNQQPLHANQQVKRVGKYIYNHIDGAYKYYSGSNQFDIYFTLYYETPLQNRLVGQKYDVEEMRININITTYQNKLRVNVIEITPEEKTLGFDLFKPEELTDLTLAYTKILQRVRYRIEKAYKDYDFLY